MLIFIDESGDSGLKIEQGSSRFFIISLVVFEDHEEAIACDQRIQLLKTELGWPLNSEFHFKKNSNRVRKFFAEAVARYNFFYYGIVINKDPNKLYGEGFKNKESFYKYACSLVFENAKDKLHDAIVVIDQSGSNEFRDQLARYLKRKMNNNSKMISKVKMNESVSNNLLQLADYVAGVISKSMKEGNNEFRKILAHREINVQVWPRI